MSPGRCVATPAAAATPAEGFVQAPAEPRGRVHRRRARTAATRWLNPAPSQTGREPERRRTEGDVEHARERRPADSHVGMRLGTAVPRGRVDQHSLLLSRASRHSARRRAALVTARARGGHSALHDEEHDPGGHQHEPGAHQASRRRVGQDLRDTGGQDQQGPRVTMAGPYALRTPGGILAAARLGRNDGKRPADGGQWPCPHPVTHPLATMETWRRR
jgi:hypothetical protein